MPRYALPLDTNGRAAVVLPIAGDSDFVVPILDIVGMHRAVTETPLAGGATFTYAAQDRLTGGMLESRLRFFVDTDQGGTLNVEESHDGTTWVLIGAALSVSANVLADTNWRSLTRRYWRVRYVNGATTQTRLRLYEVRDAFPDDVIVGNTVTVSGTVTANVTAGAQVREFAPQFTDSTTALAANATFTGTGRDTGATNASASRIRARAFSDQAGTLLVEQSRDNATWRAPSEHSFAVAAGATVQVDVPLVTRYWRVRYVNGAVAQTAFELLSHQGST